MRRYRFLSVLFALTALSGAGAVNLSGTVSGDLPARSRISAWLVSASGAPVSEFASAPLEPGGRFSLQLPDSAPGGQGLRSFSPDTLTWPGVSGRISVIPSGLQTGELKLFAYADSNGDGRRDESEALLEIPATSGRSHLVLVYVSAPVQVQAGGGLNISLPAGWSAVSIEGGKSVKASRLTEVSGLKLNVLH
ncbi:hypothetical protein HNR42_000072 [Deinobacterium chartae]|uniref:Uncharacterized protein n=1 Tax=Deinobacterium chartae TaxID=521158 RepID=A0A841HWT0_9DEIO|nr:hypothetical protein [Deinobacterium chartae]MBB6096660.1 hypothetical protein [Deinobacterium chartae]